MLVSPARGEPMKARAAVALAALLATSFPSVAVADALVEPASGTSFDSRPSSDGQTYMCLGAGVRKYLFWSVYAMDFCVEESSARAEIDTYFAGPGQKYAGLKGDALAEALRHDERFFGAMSSMRADKRAEMVSLRDASADTLRKGFVKNLQKALGSGDAEAALIGDFVSPIDHDVKAGQAWEVLRARHLGARQVRPLDGRQPSGRSRARPHRRHGRERARELARHRRARALSPHRHLLLGRRARARAAHREDESWARAGEEAGSEDRTAATARGPGEGAGTASRGPDAPAGRCRARRWSCDVASGSLEDLKA